MTKKLLIVNDDMVGMPVITEALARRGIEVVIVGSVKEALAELEAGKFDLIITDINLVGDKTGLDLIQEIRKTDKQTRIFVATGYGEFYRKLALEAGADKYFEKPIDIEEHILNPLGAESAYRKKWEDHLPAEPKKTSLRKTIHEIGNRHNFITLVSSILGETLEAFLKEKDPADDIQEIIERAVADLKEIEEAANHADELLKLTRETVYRQLNPDQVMVGKK